MRKISKQKQNAGKKKNNKKGNNFKTASEH